MVRVLDVLRLAKLRGLEWVTPGIGGDRVVRCVTVDETPECHQWLTGGEFVLSTGYPVRCGALTLEAWLEGLAQHEVAALGLADRYLPEFDATTLRAWSSDHGTAVISVPASLAWADVIAPIYAHLGRWFPERPPSDERERDQLIAELLSGQVEMELCQTRCRAVGLDPNAFDTVITVGCELAAAADMVHVRRRLSSRLDGSFSGGMLSWNGDCFVILLAAKGIGRRGLVSRCEQVVAGLSEVARGATVQAGIGLAVENATYLHRSYRQARRALECATVLYRSALAVHYDDMGLLRLLHGPLSRSDMLVFYRETLKALADNSQDELLATLRAYFDVHENLAACGRRLFLHPHTVRYRLAKVESLTGLSLANADDSLALQCALKIGRLLAAEFGT